MPNRSEMMVRLSDLGDKAVEQARRQTGDYVIPIVSDLMPLGSGTLVQIDEWQGILTAEHVVHPERADLRLDYTGHPERVLRTAVGPFAHDLSICTNALRFVTSRREEDNYGPDLAFIVLPPGSPFLAEIAARKSFYNLTLNTETRRFEALKDIGFFALCGFPAVRDFAGPPELGFSETRGIYGYSMLSGPENYEIRGCWDYWEIGVSQESADEFERTLGGVSGGAVWRIVPHRHVEAAQGEEYIGGMTLAGVAFYEMDDRSKPRFYVRAHGPNSIYRELIDLVRVQLT
jgi:hypothetical protein